MIFYVDGACSGNGTDHSSGGYGVIGLDSSFNFGFFSHYESCENTTNNREELKAILYVMQEFGFPERKWEEPIVYSDSAYAVNTYTDWMFRWVDNDWKKSNYETPENLDLVKTYYELYQKGYRINLQKIKGHSTSYYNNQADKLARTGICDLKKLEVREEIK